MTSPTFSHGDPDYLSDEQLAQLLRGINPLRVSKDNKGMSYVEAYEVKAHLTRIFGFLRWDSEVLEQHMIYEEQTEKDGKPRWSVCWRSLLRLSIRSASGKLLAVHTEGATCDATNQPSRADAHDQALKGSASQALKRCAYNIGDQFGLGLFNKGSIRPLVGRTLTWSAPEEDSSGEVSAHITTPLAPESGEPAGESQREVTSPPASKAPPLADAGPVPIPAAGGGDQPGEAVTAAEPVTVGTQESIGPLGDEVRAQNDAAGFPTAPDADGGSPAGSGEPASSPAEAVDPTPAPAGAESSPVPSSAADGPAPTPGPDSTPGSGSGSTAEPVDPTTSGSPATTAGAAITPESGDGASGAGPGSSAEPSGEPDGEQFPTASSNAPQTSADSTAADSPRSDPGPTPTNGSEPSGSEPGGIEDPIDAWEHITAALAVIRMSPPEEALGILNDCMETAARFGLGARRYADTDKAISVVLTETMRDARAAIERRRAAAAGAS